MNNQYTRRLEKIEAELNRWLPQEADSTWQTEVFSEKPLPLLEKGAPHLLRALTAPGRDLILRGGKRWRPLLMTLVCESFGGGDAALPLTPLVEFSHNATLIHDDIEDNSDERRGKPAVHIVHGVDIAINGGSFLYFLSTACIDSWAASLPQENRAAAQAYMYSLWAAYIRRIHLGQATDIYWHKNFEAVPTPEEYFSMCALKTGCFARFAVEAGMAIGCGKEKSSGALRGCPPLRGGAEDAAFAAAEARGETSPSLSLLGEAAEKLGIGFQILDDVKNLTAGIPGKKRGDDIVEGKKSLPVLLFLNRNPGKREAVHRCFNAARAGGVGVPETEELIQILSAEGVIAEAEDRGKAIIAEAGAIFASFESEGDISAEAAEARALLAGLADLLS